MSKKIRDNDYLFLSANLRARENKMVTRALLERMLQTGSAAEAAHLLTDCGYPELSAVTHDSVTAMLNARREALLRELAGLLPDSRVLTLFALRSDYHNAKVIIKAAAMGTSGAGMAAGCGTVTYAAMEKLWLEGRPTELPDGLGEAMAEAGDILARTGDPQQADIALDRAYFARLTALAQAMGSPFVAGYVRTLIDNANLRSAVRVVRMGRQASLMAAVLLPGGSASPQAVEAAVGRENGLAGLYGGTALAKAAALGDGVLTGGSLTAFETACDNGVTAYLAGARAVSFGVESAVAYLAALDTEQTQIRIVLTGLISGVAADTIRERLRDTYV